MLHRDDLQVVGLVRRALAIAVAVAAVAGAASAVLHSSAAAQSAPARVVDRTFACVPSLVGGVRKVYARAHKGTGRRGSTWDRPAIAAVETNVSGAAATAIEDELVWVTAGRPSSTATVVSTLVGYTFPMRSWGTVAVSGKRCRASSARIPLSRNGVEGGATGPFDDRWDCATGRRVLVRVRAVLASPSTLKGFRGFLRSTVPIERASLAVRTEKGKPLVYAEVVASGKSLLFTAPTCFPD